MKLIMSLIFLISCSSTAPTEKSMDIFEKIFYVRTTQNIKDLNLFFGAPKEIKEAYNEPLVAEQVFDTKEGLPLHAFVNKQSQKVEGFVLTYWVDYDAYAYLKKRFKDYKWIETEVPSTAIDVEEDKYKVELPELGITFEYDNQDSLRRPMWIFFK